ncbi:hypothetical protein MSAN_01192900 [Mycena sanguinolenta]|uniref:F-box domain-containing protein n=1 Tax=Mycena sanguinolenta TaxID=230812 RepID=A0A8H7D7E4_9AGAR|nr:hypothetical protein MSAN_01192900 [Mycena sanguinolenta]
MDISHWLPNELLVHIIQQSPNADQAALCRLSKLFRDLCLPVLYRAVKLKDPCSSTAFCSGIIENSSRADVVRSFILDVSYEDFRIDGRDDLVLASLKLMSRLEHFSFSGLMLDANHHSRILLEEYHFPQLISCNLWFPTFSTPLSDLVALFLTRHPTLKRVHLHSNSRMVTSRSPRISLPNLEIYVGKAPFILGIDAIRLKEVQLTWSDTDSADVDKIISRISSMTNPKLPFVSSHIYSSDNYSQIMISVSTHMSHTRNLRLRRSKKSLWFYSVNHDRDMIRHIMECLSGFTNLVYLTINWAHHSKAENWSVVERLVKVCPTLEACCSSRDAWRKVNGQWEECELEEFEVLAGLYDPTDY